jgi:hypothetical protein
MIEDEKNKNEELEVNLEEVETEKEVNVPLNPLENLQQKKKLLNTLLKMKIYLLRMRDRLNLKKLQLIQKICLILLKFVREFKKK